MEILYQDEKIVAVSKPSGVISHKNEWTSASDIPALQMLRNKLKTHVYMVHRLDRATSGILLFAKSAELARWLKGFFDQGKIQKTYHALVRGWVSEDVRVDHRIAGKDSVSIVEPLSHLKLPIHVGRYEEARYSFVRLTPITGRTHQLRKHMVHLKRPIIGDKVYGDRHHNRMFKENFAIDRLWLFSTSVRIDGYFEKVKNKDLHINCTIPYRCRRFLTKQSFFITEQIKGKNTSLRKPDHAN